MLYWEKPAKGETKKEPGSSFLLTRPAFSSPKEE